MPLCLRCSSRRSERVAGPVGRTVTMSSHVQVVVKTFCGKNFLPRPVHDVTTSIKLYNYKTQTNQILLYNVNKCYHHLSVTPVNSRHTFCNFGPFTCFQSDIYQMSYLYNWFSWWWAQRCSKHVENWNELIRKNNCASSWLFIRIVPWLLLLGTY